MKKALSLLLAGAMTFGLLAGCGSSSTDSTSSSADTSSSSSSTSSTTSTETTAGSKILTFAMSSEPDTLDPTKNNYSTSSTVLQNLFTGLMYLNADGVLDYACAESHTVSDDGLSYTFTLKEGLKWSDGSDLTAYDFEYSWLRTLAAETASPGAWYLYYLENGEAYNQGEASAEEVGVKAVDDLTLEVKLSGPTAYFLDLLAVTAYFPVKAEVTDGDQVWTKSADTYISNGAFRMVEINNQESYVMEKNPNYVYADETKLDGLTIVFIEDASAALTAFNSGEVDVLASALVGTEARAQYSGSEQLMLFDSIGTSYYDINCANEGVSDYRVRLALSMALDRDIITSSVVASQPEPALGFVPNGISYAGTDEDFRDVVGDLIDEDVAAAQALLAEAGYPNGEGFPTLTFITQTSTECKDVAQAMQSMWKQNLGIDVEIVTFESKVYWDEQEAGNFDICYDGWTGDYNDPTTNLGCFTLVRNETQCRWLDESAQAYDDMIAEVNSMSDNDARMVILADAETLLMEQMPIIPLYFRNTQLLVQSNCEGVMNSYLAHTMLKFADKT